MSLLTEAAAALAEPALAAPALVEPVPAWTRRCPDCGSELLVILAELPRSDRLAAAAVAAADTS